MIQLLSICDCPCATIIRASFVGPANRLTELYVQDTLNDVDRLRSQLQGAEAADGTKARLLSTIHHLQVELVRYVRHKARSHQAACEALEKELQKEFAIAKREAEQGALDEAAEARREEIAQEEKALESQRQKAASHKSNVSSVADCTFARVNYDTLFGQAYFSTLRVCSLEVNAAQHVGRNLSSTAVGKGTSQVVSDALRQNFSRSIWGLIHSSQIVSLGVLYPSEHFSPRHPKTVH